MSEAAGAGQDRVTEVTTGALGDVWLESDVARPDGVDLDIHILHSLLSAILIKVKLEGFRFVVKGFH